MLSKNLLKACRLTHLYVGVFITPAILFFALTGAIQTVDLHEASKERPGYAPAKWILVLAQIHKHQTAVLPVRKPAAAAKPLSTSPSDSEGLSTPKPIPPPAQAPRPSQPTPEPQPNVTLLRVFFLLVTLGLFTSTATGLYMTYKYNRNRRLVTLALVAGLVIPPLLLLA